MYRKLAVPTLAVALGAGLAASAAPPAKKPPAKPPANSGGANQITALEGDLVGKEYVNGATRFKFEAPRVSYAYKNRGVEEGKIWLIIPFQASNATKAEQTVEISQADLATADATVVQQDAVPQHLTLLPAAHGKAEIAFIVDTTYKPVKVIIRPQDGMPLRLMLPKGFVITPPSTTGKLGELVSNGLVKFKLTGVTPTARVNGEEPEEGHRFLTADWQIVSEYAEQAEVEIASLQLLNAEGETVDGTSAPFNFKLAPAGSKSGKTTFQVPNEFQPAKAALTITESQQKITINLK